MSGVSRILLYTGRSISCADKTNAKNTPLRRDAGQIAPAQWPVGNVLFPTRLRCVLFAKFCLRSLKVAPYRKAKSLGRFAGLNERGVVRTLGKSPDLSRFFRLYRRRLRRHGRLSQGMILKAASKILKGFLNAVLKETCKT